MRSVSSRQDWYLETDAETQDVWVAAPDQPLTRFGPSDRLVEQLGVSASRVRFRVLSVPRNASIVVQLADRFSRRGGQVWVGSAGSPVLREAVTPTAVLEELRLAGAAHAGQWLLLKPQEIVAYRIAAAVQAQRIDSRAPWPEESWDALVRRHPAWPAISFVANREQPRVTMRETAELLSEFLDPCWRWGDLTEQRRRGQLARYCGLDGKRICRLLQAPSMPVEDLSGKTRRTRLLLKHWAGLPPQVEGNVFLPRNWLWSDVREAGQSFASYARASLKFIDLALLLWAATCHIHPELFVPELFFADTTDLAAFRSHCRQEQAQVSRG